MPDLNVALRIRADLRNAVAQIDRLEKELRQTGRAGRQAAQGARQAASGIDRADRSARRFLRSSTAIRGAIGGIGFALLAREAAQLVGSLRDTGLAFERLDQRFTFGAGSLRQGAEEFRFVREESERLGLAFQPAAQGLSQLQAAVRGTGISLGQTREIFLGVAEAATVLRLSQDQVAGAFRAIEQIASKGTLQAEEIRGQLGERLPGAFQIAARAMGVTTAELNKMLEQGEVLSDDFLPRFGAQLRREFGDAAEEAAGSAQASFNRLGNEIEELSESVASSTVLPFLQRMADLATTILQRFNEINEAAELAPGVQGGRAPVSPRDARDITAASASTVDPAALRRQLEQHQAEIDALAADILANPRPVGRVDSRTAEIDARIRRAGELEAALDRVTQATREGAAATQEAYEAASAPPPVVEIPVDRKAYEKALDAILDDTKDHVRARARIINSPEAQVAFRALEARAENQRLLDEALEAANGNRKAEAEAQRLYEANELQITARFQDELAEVRRNATEKAKREAEKEASERERLARRQRNAVRGVEEAIADADLDLSEASDTEWAIAQIERWRDTHLRALEEVGLGSSIFADRVRASADRQIDAYREQATVLGSLRRAARDYARDAGDAADEAAGAFNDAVRGMEDALVSFVQTGKLSFSDLANSIIADIARIVVRQQILGPLAGVFGNNFDTFGNFGVAHGGGLAGSLSRSRSVDPRAFAFAPRYHEGGVAGLRPDEVPAILQRGETVLPRGAGVPMPVPVSVTVESTGTPQRAQGATARLDPEGFVIRIMVDDAESGGPHSQALRRFITGGGL